MKSLFAVQSEGSKKSVKAFFENLTVFRAFYVRKWISNSHGDYLLRRQLEIDGPHAHSLQIQ
jgi:hypothetical protein